MTRLFLGCHGRSDRAGVVSIVADDFCSLFFCCKRCVFKGFSALSIYKVHRTLSFLFFVRVLFYLLFIHLPTRPRSFSFLPSRRLSIPSRIPSSSDFFSSLPLPSLSPPLSPAIPFSNPRHFAMDDAQTAFATQYPSYAFDLDMMKVRVFLLCHCCPH